MNIIIINSFHKKTKVDKKNMKINLLYFFGNEIFLECPFFYNEIFIIFSFLCHRLPDVPVQVHFKQNNHMKTE